MKRSLWLIGIALAACSSTPPVSVGTLGDPTAMATVNGSPPGFDQLSPFIFIANTDGQDLRVFDPTHHLFVRGANSISPASISLELRDANGNVTVPSFRPSRITGGVIDKLGFAVVSGPATRLAVVDAQTYLTTQSAKDKADCSLPPAMATPDVSCLGTMALDVDTGAPQPTIYALLDTNAMGQQSIATFMANIENGAPVLTISGTPTPIMEPTAGMVGQFTGFALVPGSTNRFFVADKANARVLDVTLGGAVTPIPTAAPVVDVVFTPENHPTPTTTVPAGQFALAILTDGRVQVLDPMTHLPATDSSGAPESPIQFTSNVQNLLFMPCPTTPVSANGTPPPCNTTLRTDPSTSQAFQLLAFAALSDGTTVPLVQDSMVPQIFRTIDTNLNGPSVGGTSVVFSDPAQPVAPPQPATLTFDPTMMFPPSEGVTRDDTFSLKFHGTLPGFSGRTATLTPAMGGATTLTDPGATFSGLVAGTPTTAGDTVFLTPLGTDCPAAGGVAFTIQAVGAGTLTLAVPTSLSCVPSHASYEIRSSDWVLISSTRGLVQVQALGTMTLTSRIVLGTEYIVPGSRFFYPPNVTTTAGQEFSFILSGMNPMDDNAGFSFTSTSGVTPFAVTEPTVSASSGGYATGLAAIPNTLYIAVSGGNALEEAFLDQLRLTNGVVDYH